MNIFDHHHLSYRSYLQTITPIYEQAVNDGSPLPDLLIIPPGRYKVNGYTYDMTVEGLYRFFDYNTLLSINRIVYNTNPIAIISSAMWLTSQSYVDNSLPYPQMTEKAKTDKLRVACGYATLWTKLLLDGVGIPSRMVQGFASHDWHEINDGHALLEVRLGGKWVMFDFSFNSRFWKNGVPLNLLEVIENAPDYEIEFMSFDTSYDVTGLFYQGHSFSTLFEPMLSTPLLYDLYTRLLQIPAIYDGGVLYFYKTSQYDNRLLAWGYQKLSETEYMGRFYA